MSLRRVLLPLSLLLALLVLAGCGTASGQGSGGKPVVYATTNVYASIAQQVAGDHAEVHAAITRPDQDPHDYEVTAEDKLQASKAAVIVLNGGGYDAWAEKLAEGTKAATVNAVDVSGLKQGDEFNEHVFYSLDTAGKVADAVADGLAKADAANAQAYRDNAAKLKTTLSGLKAKAAAVGAGKSLTAVATEPVVGYLLADMGIKNVTPDEFVQQSETDAGPSVKTVDDTAALLRDGTAKLLVLNGQTEDAVSGKLADAAKEKSVPVVKVYETFPEGVTDYQGLIGKTIDDFTTAVGSVK